MRARPPRFRLPIRFQPSKRSDPSGNNNEDLSQITPHMKSLLRPSILCLLLCGIAITNLTVTIPQLEQACDKAGVHPPYITKVLIRASHLLDS